LDDEFNQRFLSETKFSSIVNLFAILSVFIAAMGLFGLSSFSIIQRTKELGIRKVLGASVSNISTMITSQYLKLIVIAYVIAVPLLYLGAVNWLKNYEIRIELDVLFFIIPMVLSLFIGLISIIQQTTKASLQNPVKSIRQE
jgi:putative ABC transport system permease protein